MNEHGEQAESTVLHLCSDDEEEVRRLIAGAGPRPAATAEELAAIRSAARDEWLRLVEDRRRRGGTFRRFVPVALAAGLLLALGAAFWWLGIESPAGAGPVATVELVKGEILVAAPTGRPRPLVGDTLGTGEVLATGAGTDGSPSLAALRLAGGPSLRLDGDTRIRLLSGSSIALERGAVYVDSGAGPTAPGAVTVETAFGDVRDIGTRFEVRLAEEDGEALRVRVREGSVSLVRETSDHPAAAGEELTLWPDGSIRRRSVAPHDPSWEWTLGAAPGLDIEGLVLPVYLEWVARETGWRVRFADQDLAAAAAGIRLHGTIAGLAPDESLDVVLPGSGLAYRVENGVLAITRPP